MTRDEPLDMFAALRTDLAALARERTHPLLDVPASVRLMNRVEARPGRCYDNALNALPFAPPGTFYVVGLFDSLALGGVVVGNAHCWLETPAQRILEVSPPQLGAALTWAPDPQYHDVVRYSAHDVERACAGVRFWFLASDQGGPFACSADTLASYFAA